jgi:phosphoglycerate dehydrogenase-like enzyme
VKILIAAPEDVFRNRFFTQQTIRRIEALGDVIWNCSGTSWTEEEFRQRLPGMEVCIIGRGKNPCFSQELFKNFPDLKFFGYTGGSMKKIITPDVFETGINFVCGNDAFAKPLAEASLLLMLTALRRVNQFWFPLKEGGSGWPKEKHYTDSLLGKKVGLLGYGAIAAELVEMLKVFTPDICVADPYLTDESAVGNGFKKVCEPELFSSCDVVSIHHTLTETTLHMVDKELLSRMKDGAVLVNTSRGKIIDQTALLHELETGRIFAALDVYEQEPFPADSPLRSLPNAVLSPHMGGSTVQCYRNQVKFVIDDLERFSRGEPLSHRVTRERFLRMSEKKI